MTKVILIRGLSGSGKSTLAHSYIAKGIVPHNARVVSADDWFMVEGEYAFDPKGLPKAHAWCQDQAAATVEAGGTVIVANTFSCRWEMEPYIAMAEEKGVSFAVVDIFDSGLTDMQLHTRNTHGVPLETIAAMRKRWERDWMGADIRPPWEREGA